MAGCWCSRGVPDLQGTVAPLPELGPFLALGLANHEVQQWIQDIERSRKAGDAPFLQLLYLTSLIAMAVLLAALFTWVALGLWVVALTSFLLRYPAQLVYSAATRALTGGLGLDRSILGIAGFWFTWPLIVWLAIAMSSNF